MAEVKFPTEVVDLPSKGLLYPKDSPLSSGKVEVKYMTAREEDILTSANLIKQGVVVEKLLESLIVDKSIKVDDLLIGDKNAVLIAARILAYGKEYEIEFSGQKMVVDLTQLKDNKLDENLVSNGVNEKATTFSSCFDDKPIRYNNCHNFFKYLLFNTLPPNYIRDTAILQLCVS